MTHFLTLESNGSLRRSKCGWWFRLDQHARVPSCPDCLAALEAEAEDTRTLDEMFGPDELFAPKSKPEPDPVAEFHREYDRRFGGRR